MRILRYALPLHLLMICGMARPLHAGALELPPRPASARTGGEFAESVSSMTLDEREVAVLGEVRAGNVPPFLRELAPIVVRVRVDGATRTLIFHASADYLAVGSDADYFLCPLSPQTAQRIADSLDCLLPTPRMVDAIWRQAAVRLEPEPIPPSPEMTSVPVFAAHNAMVRRQRALRLDAHPLGALVAGHKKDVVIAKRLSRAAGKVAIYGWHRPDGKPIQPLYTGHVNTWVDYSHGVRLVHRKAQLDGAPVDLAEVLRDPKLCVLVSDEGPLAQSRYRLEPAAESDSGSGAGGWREGDFGERVLEYTLDPDVRILINVRRDREPQAGKSTRLILYALPNGNTIEQTIGKRVAEGVDWHFGIQHIGAQTRRLREAVADTEFVVAYLEAKQKSWPAWKREHSNYREEIPRVIESVVERAQAEAASITLTGHSGGGSFIFGYVDAVERIPDRIDRVSFLDSNYAYSDAAGHGRKLAEWLKRADNHVLSVICYDDRRVLFRGKRVVGPNGGTYRRTVEMAARLGQDFSLSQTTRGDLAIHRAPDGRVEIILHANPENRILHTALVGDMNGFIHAMTVGTPHEGKAAEFGGPVAYEKWIAP